MAPVNLSYPRQGLLCGVNGDINMFSHSTLKAYTKAICICPTLACVASFSVFFFFVVLFLCVLRCLPDRAQIGTSAKNRRKGQTLATDGKSVYPARLVTSSLFLNSFFCDPAFAPQIQRRTKPHRNACYTGY